MASEAHRCAVTRSGSQPAIFLALDVGFVELDVGEARRLDARAAIADQGGVAIEADDVMGLARQEQREPAPAAADIEDALAREILGGEKRQESRADAGRLGHVHARALPPPEEDVQPALKYLASGWWKTRAETEASGSIM